MSRLERRGRHGEEGTGRPSGGEGGGWSEGDKEGAREIDAEVVVG